MRCLILVCLAAAGARSQTPPVVIIPGDGSNQLEARLDKSQAPHFWCDKTSDWYRLWLDTADLLAATSCWCANIMTAVNGSASRNVAGVGTRVPFWGSTEGFEELDPALPFKASAAFAQMVEALVARGYERNATLRGAPYDFRYTPDVDLKAVGDETPAFADASGYPEALRRLVEATSAAAGGARVVLVSHSMGGLQALYFLNSMSAAWKATYVAKWVAISAPLAGAAKELQLFASGDSDGLPISSQTVREEQRTYDTNHWLYPTTGWAASPWNDFGAVVSMEAHPREAGT